MDLGPDDQDDQHSPRLVHHDAPELDMEQSDEFAPEDEEDGIEDPVIVEEIITVHEPALLPLPDELPLMAPIQPVHPLIQEPTPVLPAGKLTESTRNELSTILNELEQLRFLLRVKN